MADSQVNYTLLRRSGLTEATALRDQARQADFKDGFQVDAAAVEQIDTSMILVLLAIDQASKLEGKDLAVRAPTDPFIAAFSDLGMYPALMSMEFT